MQLAGSFTRSLFAVGPGPLARGARTLFAASKAPSTLPKRADNLVACGSALLLALVLFALEGLQLYRISYLPVDKTGVPRNAAHTEPL